MNARDSGGATGMRRRLTVLAASLAAIVVLSGCETMGDVGSALDPTDWFGDETRRPTSQAQADMRARAEADAAQARGQRTPDITTVPQRPPVATPAGTRSRVTEGLVADRDNARYTDEAIRLQNIPVAGQPAPQQAVVPPPPPAPLPQSTVRTAPVAPPPPPAAAPQVTMTPLAAPAPQAAPPLPRAEAAPPSPAPQVAAVPARPAAPVPQLPARTIEGQPVRSPGDPGMTQAVATPAPAAPRAAPVAPAQVPMATPPAPPMSPQPMTSPPPAPQQMAALPQLNVRPAPERVLPAGPQQVAVIQFADKSFKLDSNDRKVLQQVAELQRQTGTSVRIVGHASSRTGQLADARRHQANLAMSQKRATAVAQALFDLGVTAQVVQIEAAADTQPLFSEAMPNGEAGNRRAEIFFVR